MLKINNLNVHASETKIIDGLSIEIPAGKVCAIMGPNGSGKSTLVQALAGHHAYSVDGHVDMDGSDLLAMKAHERSLAGLFLAFQTPVAIPGLNNLVFLQTIYNAMRAHRGEEKLDAEDFIALVGSYAKRLGIDESFWERAVNDDFSGGEKKRNDLLQMLLLDPKLMILDEVDSGLDVDGLKLVANVVNEMRGKDKTIVMITHYKRLLEHIQPDIVFVMRDGKIVHQGDFSIVSEIEAKGYKWLKS